MRALLLFTLCLSSGAAQTGRIAVKIIDRRDSSTPYAFMRPGYSTATSTGTANCTGIAGSVNCSGQQTSTGTIIPGMVGSYQVRGATLALQLPGGRVAIVNCESKYQMKGDYANRRSCRIPPGSDIEAEFNGDKAKLFWSVSLNGKKMDSETYKIIGVNP
jgi:hypothetical protein